MRGLVILLAIWAALFFSSCDSSPVSQKDIEMESETQPCQDTTEIVDEFEIDSVALTLIRTCQKGRPTLMALPGWNLPAKDWQTKTRLGALAKSNGFDVLLVEMRKSIYARQVYPETRKDWHSEKTLLWLTDTLIPRLQKERGLFDPRIKHAVVGLSTGGRGAVLVAAEQADLFGFCAALSGDFVPEWMPEDNLMIGWYGSYAKFPQRLKSNEHPIGVIDKLQTQLYLAHGEADIVVPVSQTHAFADSLRKQRPDLLLSVEIKASGQHDYTFWDGCVPEIIAGLQELQARNDTSNDPSNATSRQQPTSRGPQGTSPSPNP